MITHIIVKNVAIGKKPFLKRVLDFLLRRKTQFSMPSLRFVSQNGKITPLINLEYGMLQPIELPCPIDERYYHPEILNPNNYPVHLELTFVGTHVFKVDKHGTT